MKAKSFMCSAAILLSAVIFAGGALSVSASESIPGEPQGIPYIEFYAEQNGINPEDIVLSKAVCLSHFNWECEGGYPAQYIRDEETIRAVAEIVGRIRVTGGPDGVYSTAGGHGFTFTDEEDRPILGISIQEGMIEGGDGRYEADGLDALSFVPGVMYPGDWEEYFDRIEDEEEEYLRTHELSFPCSLFEAAGKAAYDFYTGCTADDILSIYFFHDGKNKTFTDPEEIRAIYESLCRVEVTGPGETSRWDDSWSVTVFYPGPDNTFSSNIHFSFRSGALDGRDGYDYSVKGLGGIPEACDWEEFGNIPDFRGR